MSVTDAEFIQLSQSVQAFEQTMRETHVLLERLLQQESYATQPDFMVVAEGSHNPRKRPHITCPSDVYELMKHLNRLDQEELHVLCLNRKNYVTHTEMVFRGTIDSSMVDPRDVFRLALRKRAVQIILAHNHPSGLPNPSPQDIQSTQQIVKAGKILNIHVLDHVIIGEDSFVSLKEHGSI